MTEEIYKKKLKDIQEEANKATRRLWEEYAMSNAKFKVGDIIKDHRWTLKVDRITTYVSFGLPEPVYHGAELKKDLTPKKNNNRGAIHGNDAELIGQ